MPSFIEQAHSQVSKQARVLTFGLSASDGVFSAKRKAYNVVWTMSTSTRMAESREKCALCLTRVWAEAFYRACSDVYAALTTSTTLVPSRLLSPATASLVLAWFCQTVCNNGFIETSSKRVRFCRKRKRSCMALRSVNIPILSFSSATDWCTYNVHVPLFTGKTTILFQCIPACFAVPMIIWCNTILCLCELSASFGVLDFRSICV